MIPDIRYAIRALLATPVVTLNVLFQVVFGRLQGGDTLRHALCLLILLVSPNLSGSVQSASILPGREPSHALVLTLLSDGQLLLVDSADGQILATRKIVENERIDRTGHFLVELDHRRVAVLASHCVLTLDVPTITTAWSACGSADEPKFESLARGSDETLYLVGGGLSRLDIKTLDGESGARKLTAAVVMPAQRTWWVHSTALDANGKWLFVSYHGPDTTGVDRFDLSKGTAERCGRIGGHGRVATADGAVFVTTGSQEIWEYTVDGMRTRRYSSGLEGNHLMELAVDPANKRLYAVGSCGYAGGLSAMTIPERSAKSADDSPASPNFVFSAFSPAFQLRPCGERLELLGTDELLVAQLAQPVPGVDRRGSLLMLDRASGRIKRRVALPSDPVDILALRQ